MSRSQKRAYLESIRKRYRTSNRKQKAAILDEFCAVCDYNRKYAIRILKKQPKKKRSKVGRKPRYDSSALLPHLKAVWLASDQMCSKRLKAALPLWLPYYEKEQGDLEDSIRGQLYSLSAPQLIVY